MRYTHFNQEEIILKLELPEEVSEVLTNRVVSVGYYALVDFAAVIPTPDVITDECRWWTIDQIPRLLFDHNNMIALSLNGLQRKLSYQPTGYTLLPDKFTMSELQQLHETILGQSLDRRNFEERMLSIGVLERLAERRTGGAHKAPYLYRFNNANHQRALETEQGLVG